MATATASASSTSLKLKPIGDRVIAQRLGSVEKTKSGLYLPDSAQEKPQEGKVLSVGAGERLDDGSIKAVEVKSGDRVLYGKYAGTEVTIEGEDYLILREEDVLAIVKN